MKSLEASNTDAILEKTVLRLETKKAIQKDVQANVCFQIVVTTVSERRLVSGEWRMGTTVEHLLWRMTALLPVDIVVSSNSLYLHFSNINNLL